MRYSDQAARVDGTIIRLEPVRGRTCELVSTELELQQLVQTPQRVRNGPWTCVTRARHQERYHRECQPHLCSTRQRFYTSKLRRRSKRMYRSACTPWHRRLGARECVNLEVTQLSCEMNMTLQPISTPRKRVSTPRKTALEGGLYR